MSTSKGSSREYTVGGGVKLRKVPFIIDENSCRILAYPFL